MSALTEDQLIEVREKFSNFLKDRKQRQTPERFAVLEEAYANADHFDADELYFRLKQKKVQVSRATVYNTIELLLECDLLVRNQFGQNLAKYERAYNYRQHDHLICLECNALFEFCDPRLQSVQEMVSEIFDFEIKYHSLNLFGTCNRAPCPNRKVTS